MSVQSIIEEAEGGSLLALDNADHPTRVLVAKLAQAVQNTVDGEPCSVVSEAMLRTAVLVCMAITKPGYEPQMLERASKILHFLAVKQLHRATATPAGAVMQ